MPINMRDSMRSVIRFSPTYTRVQKRDIRTVCDPSCEVHEKKYLHDWNVR